MNIVFVSKLQYISSKKERGVLKLLYTYSTVFLKGEFLYRAIQNGRNTLVEALLVCDTILDPGFFGTYQSKLVSEIMLEIRLEQITFHFNIVNFIEFQS